MAKKKKNSKASLKSSVQATATFDKSMVTDINDYHLPENSWTYARNAINNSRKGDFGKLSSEPSNMLCTTAPFAVIGAIHIEKDRWAVFSTNDYLSEIGILTEGECKYEPLVRSACFKFKASHLIKGVSKPNNHCSHDVVWDDGINPTRILDLSNIPWVEECDDSNGTEPGGCLTCTPKEDANGNKILDCDKLRLESIITTPIPTIKKGTGTGVLPNGTYHLHLAYVVNQQRVSDYTSMSNTLSLFTHDNVNGSIDVSISNLDTEHFDDFMVVVVSTVAEKTVAKLLGVYSTNVTSLSIDSINLESETIPLSDLPIITPVPDKSDAVFSTGKYLLRVGPTDKFDFNYQPLANQIETYWQCIEYKKDYYKNGGTNVGHMRDEVYPYFIRWLFNTGDKTSLFHIPGRAPQDYVLTTDGGTAGATLKENVLLPNTFIKNVIEEYTPKVFEVFNTAYMTSQPNTILSDGGKLIAEGKMGYVESLEFYPDKNPTVWNASANDWSASGNDDHDLCGKPIRHHKFPENTLNAAGAYSTLTNHYSDNGEFIRVMGVRFDNIKPPMDNNGKVIKNIVGYEILRGSRDGNKTVLYKGLINNMFEYNLPSKVTKRKGLYANYPFNDLSPDYFISKAKTHFDTIGGVKDLLPNDTYSKKHFTFNSPDTQFARPFLNASELKIYGLAWGYTTGSYVEASDHPKHKFLTDGALALAFVAGVGYAAAKQFGKKTKTYNGYKYNASALPWSTVVGTGSSAIGVPVTIASAGSAVAMGTLKSLLEQVWEGASEAADLVAGTETKESILKTMMTTSKVNAKLAGSLVESGYDVTAWDGVDQTPKALKALQQFPLLINNISDGGNSTLNLIYEMTPYRQFAYQYQTLCEYDQFYIPEAKNRRRKIDDARYLKPGMQDFQSTHLINHMHRQSSLVFNTFKDVENPKDLTDTSRPDRMSNLAMENRLLPHRKLAVSHYVAFKAPNRRQYGQLHSIKAVPTKSGYFPIDFEEKTNSSGIIFGGDTYIGKYSEKNTLFYFTRWLESQLDGAVENYALYKMFDYTSFWMNTTPFNINDFFKSIGDGLKKALKSLKFSAFMDSIKSPSDYHCFDRNDDTGWMTLKNCYMYLFNSGLKNFFVESELNIDCRDYEDEDGKKHYPVQSELSTLFNMRVIKNDNYFKLDRSLCENFLSHARVSWGSLQDIKYNPLLSSSCYTKRPKRLIYSLPQETLAKKNNWGVFLPNNYKDFTSNVVSVKPVDRTGAMILFENEAPALLPGVDELQTGNGIKLVIGDGGLFARDLQRISNTESSYEYASCQSRLSVANTPYGLYWINLNQGKIFNYAGGLKEISLKNNRLWLNIYLPYALLESFPYFDITDNPVNGIGCQTIYDNEYALIYFCKKDYRLKDEFRDKTLNYLGNGVFEIDGFKTYLNNPFYFEDASFTLSYDPKAEEFVSYHDWHPDLAFSGKNTFLTTKKNTFWRHNKTCQSYCNFYGVDYPFEVEFQLDSKFATSTIRNIEYYLENFIYSDNCYDRFHVLDRNFDEAIIYNSEQCSGLLKLALTPKNDINELIKYPKVAYDFIEILFSKEEQQYRFNQFWDITKNRGEFVEANEPIWNTQPNGYIRDLNFKNLSYKKDEFQRKKFRHFNNRVLLRRNKCENVEMLVSLAFGNLHLSPR